MGTRYSRYGFCVMGDVGCVWVVLVWCSRFFWLCVAWVGCVCDEVVVVCGGCGLGGKVLLGYCCFFLGFLGVGCVCAFFFEVV